MYLVQPGGASSVPGWMLLLAVMASWCCFYSIFVLGNAGIGGVPLTADCTLRGCLTCRLVVSIALAVIASKWFRVVGFGAEPTPYAQVYFVWNLAYEGA